MSHWGGQQRCCQASEKRSCKFEIGRGRRAMEGQITCPTSGKKQCLVVPKPVMSQQVMRGMKSAEDYDIHNEGFERESDKGGW